MVEQESQRDYLHGQIAERLVRLELSAEWHRKTYIRGQMATVVLSAAITIIAGMKSLSLISSVASDLVLILGALVTVISAWSAFFSPQESWRLTRMTYSRLRSLQAKLDFDERGDTFSQDQTKVMTEGFLEYQKILDDYNEQWQKIRSKAKS